MMFLVLCFGFVLLPLLLRLAVFLRLQLPLLYHAAVYTVLRPWYLTHPVLAEGILYGLMALTVLSWLVTLFHHIWDFAEARSVDRAAVERFRERVRQARRSGEHTVSTEGLWG